MTEWPSTRPHSWPTLKSGFRNPLPLPSIWLPWFLMMQALMCDCLEMKDETRYVGAAAVTLTEMTLARYFSPVSRTDWSDPGSQRGKSKFHHYIHQLSVGMLLLSGMYKVWSMEKEGFSLLGKNIFKNLNLLEVIWFPLQIAVLCSWASDLAAQWHA